LIFTETNLKGAFIIDVKKLEDERGFFGRTFCQKEFEEHGLNPHVVQANVSYNKIKGTLRGMHFQLHPYEETKLVRCVRGGIYDVIIDLRKDSPTYTKWIGVELREESYRMLFVPEGFGHGFITLEDNTEVIYQVSQFYTPGSESGIRWNDPAFNIEWPIEPVLISEKDRQHSDYII
jgi:dTDP-4-dehydrorhamnose 3,5-epimerase